MLHRFFISLLLVLLVNSGVRAAEDVVDRYIPDASVVGQARFKVLLWEVFDATLIAPSGQLDREKPFALKLSYLRELSSQAIVKTSIREMTSQRPINPQRLIFWKGELSRILPDINKGDTITGIRDEQGRAAFYLNDEFQGAIDDPEFAPVFFDIWLGEKTSEPGMRQKLLGEEGG